MTTKKTKSEKKEPTLMGKIAATIVFGLIAILIFGPSADDAESTPTEIVAPMTWKEKVDSHFNAYGSHSMLIVTLKETMNDPSSFEHIETKYWYEKNTYRIYMKYRGANAFGALVINEILVRSNAEGDSFEIIE